ncbi:MAG: hypothetical protein HWN68_06560 [Desulfobacterales bacterium]|nr:hypothetical protein [Desulfobacterales bacterium]
MPRRLKDLEVEEISLVDSAATRKQFYIVKRRNQQMEEFVELLKSFLGEDEITDEDIEKANKVPEAALKAIKGAVNILNKYKADFPPEILNALKTLTKYAAYGYPSKRVEKVDLSDLLDVEKAGAKLSKATVEELKKVLKIIESIIGEREKEVKKTYGELPADVVAQLEELRAMKEEKKTKNIEKARDEFKKEILDAVGDLVAKEVKKEKPVKKSITGQEGGDDNGGKKGDFPSVAAALFPEEE